MANCDWLGRANPRAHVLELTVGGTAADTQVYTVTINGKTISYTADGSDTNDTIAAALQALLAASTIIEFSELTWTVDSSVITATANTAGADHVITTDADGTGTFVTATSIAATGPNHWNDANNWSSGSVPVNSDNVTVDRPVSILYGLDQSAVTLASLVITANFSSNAYIGLPRTNVAGYQEFRDDYLKIGATACRIGVGDGIGANRIKIDFGSVQTSVEVRASGISIENGVPAILLKGTHASNAFDIQGGNVGIAIFGGETATANTLTASPNANVICGEGVTLGTVTGEGNVRINSAATTLTQNGGSWTVSGSGAVTTLTQNAGLMIYKSSGTITTATIAGVLDCSQDATGRTITNCTLKPSGRIRGINTITFSNKIGPHSDAREVFAA